MRFSLRLRSRLYPKTFFDTTSLIELMSQLLLDLRIQIICVTESRQEYRSSSQEKPQS